MWFSASNSALLIATIQITNKGKSNDSTTATSRQLAKDVSFIPGPAAEKQHVVLVVDDEPTVLSTATDALNAAGYQCLTARSASQALITLKNPNYIFDLMISDVLMSGMNGIDLMKHAFKIHPTLPVIVMSGELRNTNRGRSPPRRRR